MLIDAIKPLSVYVSAHRSTRAAVDTLLLKSCACHAPLQPPTTCIIYEEQPVCGVVQLQRRRQILTFPKGDFIAPHSMQNISIQPPPYLSNPTTHNHSERTKHLPVSNRLPFTNKSTPSPNRKQIRSFSKEDSTATHPRTHSTIHDVKLSFILHPTSPSSVAVAP